MEYEISIISLMFLLAFCLYIFLGIYILRLNPRGGIHRAFFALSIALSIWSLGYARSNSAASIEVALFWIRFSAIGKMALYSIVLHFMLLLANEQISAKQGKRLMLVHIPAVINIYVFGLSNTMALAQYNMIEMDYGWINKPVSNVWSYFYYLYYIVYIVSSLIIVWGWKRAFKNQAVTRQANFFFTTFIAALVAGTFTDIIASSIFPKPLPQMAPIFILLPAWAMYYSARYYHVMNKGEIYKTDIIVTGEDRKIIFNNLSLAFYAAAILAFIAEYVPYRDEKDALKFALLKGLSLAVIGLIIRFIQNIKKESAKENLTIMVLVLSIPAAILQYLRYGGITAWAFPMVIMISSVIFSKRTLLILTSVIAIMTQIVIWILRPEVAVVVDGYDYILRIGMLLVAFLISLYINKIYLAKIQENKYQISFQKMISCISFQFVSLNQDNFDEKINNLLRQIGVFFNVDRTYLFTINHSDNTMTYSNEWCNTGINPEVGTIDKIPLDVFPWWIDQLNHKGLVYIEDVDFMPEEAGEEQKQLHRQEVKSLVSVPVMGEEKIQAFIGIDSVLKTKKWSEEKIGMLNIMANILSSGINKIKADQEIEMMAYYDNLTKLPNRYLFEYKVNQAIDLSEGVGGHTCVIFMNLDNFKSVNDTIGHKGGDALLRQVAKGLQVILQVGGTAARFGGDEFVMMMSNITDYTLVTKTVDKIMKTFSDIFIINGQEILLTASAGIASYPLDGEDCDTLVKNADIAMNRAKSKGKNQYALCTKEMKDEMRMSTQLSNDLHGALERDEFIIYYQPQIDLLTNKIIGVEALLRWVHPTRGMISPGIFIPLAEKNSLINSIGEWVLKTACMQNKKWQDMGLPHMDLAVNLSGVQIINPKIAENIERIIKETGLDPKYVELEITESIAITKTEHVMNVLTKLKAIGTSIAIDDFGTEYSSLSRLKLLPVDRIKIDMQFVQGIDTNEKDKAITMVIINLAKSLGLNVIAEGVETQLQLDFLQEKMCDSVQGYFFYKPMPAQEMEDILKKYQVK